VDKQVIIEKYYSRLITDFDTYKRVCSEIAIIQSKHLRNKIAGFTIVGAAYSNNCIFSCLPVLQA
jgi:ribosomal protein S17E